MWKMCLLFIAVSNCCLANAKSLQNPALIKAAADLSFINFMSGAMTRGSPQQSMACFNYYSPILSASTDKYEKSYGGCLSDSAEAKGKIGDSMSQQREDLEDSRATACQTMASCNDEKDILDFADCYSVEVNTIRFFPS